MGLLIPSKDMNEIRFISDPHFGHRNIAIKRGFKDAGEMNEYIISQWNSVVRKRDVVYILGDITMERASYYHLLNRLNGFKKVILGNHDRPQDVIKLLNYVNSVASIKYFNGKELGKFILTHVPIHPSEFNDRSKINIHGHVHEKTLDDKRYINVSAENIDYIPKTLKQLIYGKDRPEVPQIIA